MKLIQGRIIYDRLPSPDDYARVMWPVIRRGTTRVQNLIDFPEHYDDMDHTQKLVLREMISVGLRAMGIKEILDS